MGRLSIRVLRLLLAAYPREFRERFGADLERDFADLLETRGAGAAWTYAWSDLRRAMPMTRVTFSSSWSSGISATPNVPVGPVTATVRSTSAVMAAAYPSRQGAAFR